MINYLEQLPDTALFTIYHDPAYYILMACSNKGITTLWLGDNADVLRTQYLHIHPDAQENPETLAPIVEHIQQCIHHQNTLALPLDLIGTDFQKRVWQQLTQIPTGETVSYSQLAQQLNIPKATRAVAKACALNNIAILVPCHRVISKSGQLTGFRWGLPTKELLLSREKNNV